MRRSAPHSAFTLVELMVSIAIALLLVIGVNTVFKVTSQTVGAGNALLTANRDARTIMQTFLADTNNIDAVPGPGSTVGDGPFFVIRSEHVYAYRNADDQQAATNQTDPSNDTKLFPAAGYPGSLAPVPSINIRSHRVDRMSFFARGMFARQTTDDGNSFVSTAVGNEALLFYGHSQQPTNVAINTSNTWVDPGDLTRATNPNNYYAADWMLSRMAMVLMPYPALPAAQPASAYYRADQGGLSPLNLGPAPTGTKTSLGADASISRPANTDWATITIAGYNSPTRSGGIQSYSGALSGGTPIGPNFGNNYWDTVINYRYQSSPFVLAGNVTPKITASTLSQCAPNLIRGCSQFIVEYAGNYYTKDDSGNAAPNLNDGTTGPVKNPQLVPTPDPTGRADFYSTNNPDGTIARHTRWYGYPRAISGTTVQAANGDVVPLRDVLAMLNPSWKAAPGSNGAPYADAEHFSTSFPPTGSDYWSAMSPATDKVKSSRYTYTAAWGPDVQNQPFPKMIRVIVEVDDHEGRMNQPQRYEFIYDVQQ